jgi:alkylhydroperoxidase family enzyme
MSTAASYSYARMHLRTEHHKRGSRAPTTDLKAVATDARRVNCRRRCAAASSLINPETPRFDYGKMAVEASFYLILR